MESKFIRFTVIVVMVAIGSQEKTSLSEQIMPMPPSSGPHFYAPISVNNSCTVAGQVRQHGNFLFSIIYNAPLAVAAYQRETAYRIFDRALNNMDIATGKLQVSDRFQTNGPQNVRDMRREIPKPALDYCYILSPGEGCTDEQIAVLENGSAVVKDYILVDQNSTELFPEVVGTQ